MSAATADRRVTERPPTPSKTTLPPVPRRGLRGLLARRAFAFAVGNLRGPLRVRWRDRVLRDDPNAPELRIHDDAFFRRLGNHGNVGFAESYMAGEWEADDLAGVLAAFAAQVDDLVPPPFRRLRRLVESRRPAGEANTLDGARTNIHRHYDLSNAFFALFLDETMTYSCALFADGDDLATAQRRKYDRIARLARVSADMHVLEIGTGWGGMAMHLATTRGCRVTTTTISAEQASLARERIAAAGLDDRIDVVERDYRELAGRFDAIVSIEMFEAVGEEYWAEFFAVCDRLLAPGGRVGLQTITMPHGRFLETRHARTWIQKYIFPGGALPSNEALYEAIATGSSLRPVERHEIGLHYARTLELWRARFMARLDDVRALGFDREFERMWELYLAYCEAGFATRAIGDLQVALEKPA